MHRTKIVFAQYTLPAAYPPVMNASAILATEGATVALWGVGAYGDASSLQVDLKLGMTQRLLPYESPGIWQKVQYVRFTFGCLLRTILWRPNVVYVSDMLAFPYGLLASFVPSVKVIAHEHDTPTETGGMLNRVLQWTRRKLFRRAIVTVVPQDNRAELIQKKQSPKRLVVVWNCPRKEEVASPPVGNDGQIVLWYHGSLGPSQFPESVVAALPHLPTNYLLKFAGYETIGQRGYAERLLGLASDLGIASRVEYVGAKPTRSGLFSSASKCDIGLALFARSFREPMVGASNKPFDYLACGLALLMNDTREWTTFFQECPSARSCNPESPTSIADAILGMTRNYSEFIESRRVGQQLILDRWNYEQQFEPIRDLILSGSR